MIEATEVSPRVIKIMNGAARDLGERLKSRYNNSQFGLASDYESRQCHHAEP
ncbi:hypothetical protein JW796_03375 [Candidatus Dojkabacteria bacterium]|nr:hypothetical protein [Candidatus Dojkabacteria bacterium]